MNDLLKLAFRVFLIGLLILPWLGLIRGFDLNFQFDAKEFYWALKNSMLQASLSAVVSLFLGGIGALGLLWLRNLGSAFLSRSFEVIFLIPSLLPTIYIILAGLEMLEPFPMGIIGIVFIHGIINMGLVAVLISQAIQKKLSSLSEVSWILGIKKWSFIRKVAWPILRVDLGKMFLFVFSLCFTSFTVPLMVGGGRGTTLEVLIYEKIRFDADWGSAIVLTLIQVLLVLLLARFLSKEIGNQRKESLQVRLIPSFFGFLFFITITAWIYAGYGFGIWDGLHRFPEILEMQETLLWAAAKTIILSVSVGIFIFIGFLGLLFLGNEFWVKNFLSGYVSPSTILIGFGTLLFFQPFISFESSALFEWLRLGTALWILFFPTLMRWGGHAEIERLQSQRDMAHLLGASSALTFREVLLPQALDRASALAAMGAFWVSGEFALSTILLNQDTTLAMITQSFVSSYRLSLGTLVSVLMVVCGLVSYMILRGVGHVYRRSA